MGKYSRLKTSEIKPECLEAEPQAVQRGRKLEKWLDES